MNKHIHGLIATQVLVIASLVFSVQAELPVPVDPDWTPVRDTVYLQEIEGRLETKEPLLAVAVLDNILYVGSTNGVQRLEQEALVATGGPEGTVIRMKTLNGCLYVFLENGLWRLTANEWEQIGEGAFVDGCVLGKDVAVASPSQIYRVENDQLVALMDRASKKPILGISSYAETLYIRYETRVGFLKNRSVEVSSVSEWGQLPEDSVTRDMMGFGRQILVPTDKGLAVLRGTSWCNITGKDGLCYEDTTCVAKGFEKDDYWVGTMRGAIRVLNGEFQYFGYQRWLPDDKVNAIACGDKVVYIATDGGLGIIRYDPYTLQKKAAWYERWIEEWGMRRVGFISTLTWDGERKEWIRFISDNDGSWAAHLLNGLSFKYAVTKDPVVREQAVDVFRSLKWCEEITPIPGFPARAIATVGEPAILSATGSGGMPSEWNPTPDGKFLWKGDTSSDEVDSHVYATTIFYELVAQGKEKEAAREHLSRITGHIVDNGWVLRDLDGEPTRWARWDPEFFKSIRGFAARGLNGLEALAMTTSAWAVTGDDKFRQGKQQLMEWDYPAAVLRQKIIFPATHFDDHLAFLAYFPLLNYETDPQLRSIYRRSLERSWEIKRLENMVWFNYVYGALTGNDMDNERCLKNLREWPLDCHSYTYINSHRSDLNVLPEGYVNYISDTKCMSARNIGPTRWDDDFMRLDGGGGGMGISDPSAYLDAYWMARYYGMILPPDVEDEHLLTVEKRDLQLGAKPYNGPPRPDLGF